MKTAIITGMTGQDGTYLAEHLLSKGYRVLGTSRSAGETRVQAASGASLIRLDLDDGKAVLEFVRGAAPDEIYHLAAQSSVGLSLAEPAATFRANAIGTLNLLEAVRALGRPARVFLAGSGEVFGDLGSERAREATAFRPRSPYGASKVAAIELGRVYRQSYGLYVSIGYLYNHESPLRSERYVTRKIVKGACRIARGESRELELGDLSVVRDWGWAPEYVEAMALALTPAEPDDFVIATGESHSLERFAEEAFARVGLEYRDHVKSVPALLRPSEIPVMSADPGHALERLGWSATVGMAGVVERLVAAEGLGAQL